MLNFWRGVHVYIAFQYIFQNVCSNQDPYQTGPVKRISLKKVYVFARVNHVRILGIKLAFKGDQNL